MTFFLLIGLGVAILLYEKQTLAKNQSFFSLGMTVFTDYVLDEQVRCLQSFAYSPTSPSKDWRTQRAETIKKASSKSFYLIQISETSSPKKIERKEKPQLAKL
jgi:hypothetical protein